jgi:hypothetical protein
MVPTGQMSSQLSVRLHVLWEGGQRVFCEWRLASSKDGHGEAVGAPSGDRNERLASEAVDFPLKAGVISHVAA